MKKNNKAKKIKVRKRLLHLDKIKNKYSNKNEQVPQNLNKKTELLGILLLIISIIIALNVTNVRHNYNYNKKTETKQQKEQIKIKHQETSLLKQLSKNYTYDIEVTLKEEEQTEENNNQLSNNNQVSKTIDKKYNYSSKSYQDNLIINKKNDDNTTTYYKVKDNYYQKQDDNYSQIKAKDIYDAIDGKYIELSNILEYIKQSSLEHLTTYSSGKKEYVYNLKLSKLIPEHHDDDLIEIDITTENDTITMNIDYTNLLTITDSKVLDCKLIATYKDINKVEAFTIINDDENTSPTVATEENTTQENNQ